MKRQCFIKIHDFERTNRAFVRKDAEVKKTKGVSAENKRVPDQFWSIMQNWGRSNSLPFKINRISVKLYTRMTPTNGRERRYWKRYVNKCDCCFSCRSKIDFRMSKKPAAVKVFSANE